MSLSHRSHPCTKLLRLLAALVFFATLGLSTTAAAQSPVGVYAATIGGERVELRINADGSALVMGEPARWQRTQGGIILTDAQNSLSAQIQGNQISFLVQGMQIVLYRQNLAFPQPANTSPQSGASGAAPRASLKGKRYRVAGVNASFTLPHSWKAQAGDLGGGKEGVKIFNPRHPQIVIVLSSSFLSRNEAAKPIGAILRSGVQEQFGQYAQITSGPFEYSIQGKSAGHLLLSGNIEGRMLNAHLGGVKMGQWVAIFFALYDANQSSVALPVFETMLASFEGKAPRPNTKLAAKLVGCWQLISNFGEGRTYSVGSEKYQFDQGGNYAHESFMSVNFPGSTGSGQSGYSDKSHDAGSFGVFGNELYLESNKGSSKSFNLRAQSGGFRIGNGLYRRCP